jgi:hypothetical protein
VDENYDEKTRLPESLGGREETILKKLYKIHG